MNDDNKKTIRNIHARYHYLVEDAIKKRFYLEALALEYSYIEARVNKIMETLNMPCALVQDTDAYRDIGINAKLGCLQQFLKQESPIFAESKLTNSKMNKIKSWCNSRNERFHNLYKNIDNYHNLTAKNKELAESGFEYSKLLADERNRIKKLQEKQPELFVKHCLSCTNGKEKRLKKSCIEAKKIAKLLK